MEERTNVSFQDPAPVSGGSAPTSGSAPTLDEDDEILLRIDSELEQDGRSNSLGDINNIFAQCRLFIIMYWGCQYCTVVGVYTNTMTTTLEILLYLSSSTVLIYMPVIAESFLIISF